MISFTRQTSFFATTLLLITIAATLYRQHCHPFAAELAESEFLPQLWQQILSALLLFVTAILVNRATVKAKILKSFSTLPVSLFGFTAVGILLSPNILTASTLALLTVIALIFLVRSLHSMHDKEFIFTGSLFLGILPIIYPPSALYVAALLIIIFIAPLSFRQIIIAVTGYLLPLAATSYTNWYLGNKFTDVAINIWNSIITPAAKISLIPLPFITILIGIVLTMLLICGITFGTYSRYTMLAASRKTIQLSIWMFILGIVILFFVPGGSITIIPSVAVSITIITSFALDRMEAKWANWFYVAIVTLVIIHLLLY